MSHFVRTFKRRKLFLDQLELGSSVAFAAMAADGSVKNFKAWKAADPDFASDWDEAVEAGTDYLEDVATERAVKKSDALMMMMLKARRPDKFDRGSKLELSGGINVEGSKAKLLNKIARLQAQGGLLAGGDQTVAEVSGNLPQGGEGEGKSSAVAQLPAPDASIPVRGSKRRAAAGGGRKQASA